MVGYRRRQQNFWKLSSLSGNLNLRILFSFCRLTQLNRPSSLKYPCFMAFYNTGDKTKHGNSFLNAFSWTILCKFRHKYSLNFVLKLQQITIDSIKYIYIYIYDSSIYIYIIYWKYILHSQLSISSDHFCQVLTTGTIYLARECELGGLLWAKQWHFSVSYGMSWRVI